MRAPLPAIVFVACSLVACKDPPPPAPTTSTTPSASVSANASAGPTATCNVTIFPGDKVTTPEGEEKIPAGKPLGIGAEGGKTYCLFDKKLTVATKLADARAMVPPECTVDDRLGASHLVCRTIGLRLTFTGPNQAFAYFDLFAKDTDPFPAPPAPSTSTSATPIAPGCDVMLVPGVRVQFPASAQDVATSTGPVNGEPMPGKTYCVFGAKLTSKTSYTDAQKLAPKTCRMITVKGGWHLVCSEEGIRFSFGSGDGTFFRYSLFTGAPDAGVP
jgi:hypothetical protein